MTCALKAKQQELVWWHTPVIPVLERVRQEGHVFGASLEHIIRPHFEKTKSK
jgi:hypothetical protein